MPLVSPSFEEAVKAHEGACARGLRDCRARGRVIADSFTVSKGSTLTAVLPELAEGDF